MKYLMLLSLFLVGCSFSVPKTQCPDAKAFHFQDRVKVISGFYTGTTGHVVFTGKTVIWKDDCYTIDYYVSFDGGRQGTIRFKDRELELIR